MEYVEKLLGESADKHCEHEEHKTTMDTRLECLDRVLGDSADKHTKEIESARATLANLHAAFTSCAKTEHHASLEQRLDYLEKLLGDSADQHANELADHKNTMHSRMTEYKSSNEMYKNMAEVRLNEIE